MEQHKKSTSEIRDLLAIAAKIKVNQSISPQQADKIIGFKVNDKQSKL